MRCRRPGARLTLELNEAARVRATLARRAPGARRFKPFGAVRFGRLAAGRHALRFTRTSAGRLRKGRYRMTLRAAEDRRALTFRVV